MRFRKHASTGLLLALSVIVFATPSGALAKSHTRPHKPHRSSGAVHKTHTVSFYARVVRSSARGLVVRTSSGKLLSFSAKQLRRASTPKPTRRHPKPTRRHPKPSRRHPKPSRRHPKAHGKGLRRASDIQVTAGSVVVNIIGLQPGALVQITETTDPDGNVTITITLPPPPPPGSGPEVASGIVSELDSDAFDVQTSDGSDLRFNMAADSLSNLNLQTCDTVDVTYHQDAGILVADSVTVTGASVSGDCAPTQDATGEITQVSADGLTISADQGPLTFAVDPSTGITDGYQVGDLVDVTYTQNDDGSLTATDVQFVEEDTSGTVTAVTTNASGGSLTITDDNTGQSETFIPDPNGVQINATAFTGVSVGDEVELTYHQSAGQLVADTVCDDSSS